MWRPFPLVGRAALIEKLPIALRRHSQASDSLQRLWHGYCLPSAPFFLFRTSKRIRRRPAVLGQLETIFSIGRCVRDAPLLRRKSAQYCRISRERNRCKTVTWLCAWQSLSSLWQSLSRFRCFSLFDPLFCLEFVCLLLFFLSICWRESVCILIWVLFFDFDVLLFLYLDLWYRFFPLAVSCLQNQQKLHPRGSGRQGESTPAEHVTERLLILGIACIFCAGDDHGTCWQPV